MKTYEEMAQSVLQRAKTCRAIRKRRITTVTAAVCALTVCLGILIWKTPKQPQTLQTLTVTEPSEATVPTVTKAEPRITLLYSEGTDSTAMDKGVVVPSHSQVRVKNVAGLTQEEKEAVYEAEKKYADDLIKSFPDSNGYDWTQYDGEEVVITSINAGHLILKIQDEDQVESIHASVKGAVQLMYMPFDEEWEQSYWELMCDFGPMEYPLPREYRITKEDLWRYIYDPYGGIEVSWLISGELDRVLGREIALPDLQETITFTVTFTDGTVETHPIDLIFNEDGTVYYIYQGLTASA